METAIDQLFREEVRPVLEPGEELLWAGRPEPLRFARAKIVQVLIGALFLLLLFLVYRSSLSAPEASVSATSRAFSLRPAILITGGLLTVYSILLPVVAYRTARRTVYMATDRRVVSLTRGQPARVLRYNDMQIPILNLNCQGPGDIIFSRQLCADGAGRRSRSPFFLGIWEAERVHQLIVGRIPRGADVQTKEGAVQDYLELLLQGKKTLDEDWSRE